MGRHRRRGWVLRFTRAVASLATICALCVTASEGAPGESRESRVPNFGADSSSNTHGASPRSYSYPPSSCPSAAKTADHFLLVVSTIDGSVSALDMRTSGDLRWSVKGDDRPLLSSSITNIQVNRDGVSTRLIPSLDGGLYEFDGEDIKAIPMTAESLLSSSLRITDNCVMVGGKEVGSYGVDVSNGQLSYKCTSAGCKDTTEAGSSNGDMLIITRNMQTVRAVDVNSGSEKWNFSVGQHDLMFVRSPKDKPGIEHDDLMPEYVDEDVMVHNCSPHEEEEEEVVDEEQLKRLVKVVVSDGLIVGLNPDDPSEMAWSRKFSSPVAKAWILHRGKLEILSLFDSQVVPSLSASQPPFPPKHGRNDPMLYVGTHKRQLYVQKQELNPNHCEKKLPWVLGEWEREEETTRRNPRSIPRVTWRPYLSKSMSQTPLFGGNEAPQAPLLGQGKGEYDDKDNSDDDDSRTSLTVWHENYPFDMGYYLYPSCSASVLNLDPALEEESIMDVLPASLWMWWKEVVVISVLTSLFVHIVYTRLIYKRRLLRIESNSLDPTNSSGSLASSDSSPFLLPDKAPSAEFKSRFADEFECIEQMGKGGYGIVFRAKNKVDEQEYAVKRIALPSDAAVKKKMLREVQTLAKLDHVGIVRYFHSWIEDPPPGWQEERDQAFSDLGLSEGMSPQTDTTLPSSDVPSTSTQPLNGAAAKPVRQPPSLLADILPFRTDDLDLQPSLPRSGTGSGEFSLHSNAETSTDESGSFSLGGGDQREVGVEESQNSLSIVFQNSDDELSGVERNETSCSGGGGGGDSALPFNRYTPNKDRSRNNTSRNDSSRSRSDNSKNSRSRSVSKSYESGEDSLSIVFEDSCQGEDRTSSNACEQSRSAILSDSSYGGSLENTESGEKQTESSDVHFTLSSHGLSQLSSQKEGGGEGKEGGEGIEGREKKVEKKTLPKLYLYIQMQLCQLETLKDWLIANTLNRERLVILDIFEQIVSAVDYVHARGHIHRDLKPSNIFFALDSTVKVGDFGLVTAIENQPDLTDPSPTPFPSSKHTAEVGTQLYMSPEQIQKKAYDQKVDIFSLGMIFLELLMPFTTGMERVTTLHNARKGHFPERFCRELPLESELVKQLMSPSPHKRPTTQQILEHQLLKDFTPTPRRVSFRYRTISSSSNHSDPAIAL